MIKAIAVLRSELTVTAARQALRDYSGLALVVVRRSLGAETVWYVLGLEEVRRAVSGAGADDALADVLELDELKPVETRQQVDPLEGFVGLVLDGDRLVGVHEAEPDVPPVTEEAELSRRVAYPDRRFRAAAEPETVQRAFDVLPVFYATDRKPADRVGGKPFYTAARGNELVYGVAEVAIPERRDRGKLQRPAWWRLEFREDPARHLVVLTVEPLAGPAFLNRVRATAGGAKRKEALVFVHGYRVTFEEALLRTAQLSWDLGFEGVPLLYSWPSKGTLLGYTTDETNAGWTLAHFKAFLDTVQTQLGLDAVHILAHSMGNRPLIEALRTRDATKLGAGAARLRQVILAAPDFDAGTFRDLADKFHRQAERVTLYASSNDKALRASRELRSDLARLGESGGGLVIVNGVDTIDASEVDTSLLGHSYYGERTILADLFYLLRDGTAPGDRFGLSGRKRGGLPYWVMAP